MNLRPLLVLAIGLLSLNPILYPARAEARSADEPRMVMIREIQDLRADKGNIGFDEHTGEIATLIEKGDAGLAFQAAKSGASMLDNEAYFAVLANAVLFHLDTVKAAWEQLPSDTAKSIIEVCEGSVELAFEDTESRAKFNKNVTELKAFASKLPKTPPTPGKTRPAFIDDPDGYTNVRLLPDTKAPIIDEIRSGEEFEVISEKGKDWYYVRTPRGDIAWVHKSRVHYKYAQ